MELMRLESVASIIQNKLNEISEIMFEQEQIEEETFFVINDNFQKVDERIKKGGKDYVKGTLRSVNSRMPDDSFAGVLFEEYVINFTYTYTKKDILEKILNQYSINEGINPVDKIDGLTISKAVQKARWMGKETIGNDENREKGKYQLFVAWTITIGGITGKETSIEIDGEQLDFLNLQFRNDKALLPTIPYGNNSHISASFKAFDILLPIQILSDKNKELLDEVMGNTFNKKHNLKILIGSIIYEYTVVLRIGQSNQSYDNNPTVFMASFEEALDRTILLIDNVEVPITNFNFQKEKSVDSIPFDEGGDIATKSIAQQTGYSISLSCIYLSTNNKCVELLKDILDKKIMTKKYELNQKIPGGIDITYKVMLQSGTYAFNDNAELVFSCVFIEIEE